MCGICGVLKFPGINFEITQDLITDMRDTMVHRGPDDYGTYISHDGRIGFGHRRLSIIDLSPAGRQPMSNEDGSIWITYNGEFYNYADYVDELKRDGHKFRTGL